MGIGSSSSGGEAAGAWSWPLFPSSVEVKNAWSYSSTPQYAFMAWCWVQKSTGTTLPLNFTFLRFIKCEYGE
jgi:hypothetical protein